MEAPFTRLELLQLAHDILALDCPHRFDVHAEKMIRVKEDEYSRSFYEVAIRVRDLRTAGYSLDVAVKALARWIPTVEDLEFKLLWREGDNVTVKKSELHAMALEIEDFDVPSPDRALASRISSKKASKDEWRLFALRYVDYQTRISDLGFMLWEFCSDSDRAKRELAALKLCVRRTCFIEDRIEITRPLMPPWRDVDFWDANLNKWGYGTEFSLSFDTHRCAEFVISSSKFNGNITENTEAVVATPSTAIVPVTVSTDAFKQVRTEGIDDDLCSSDEDYEVAVLKDDIYEDQKMYEEMDEERNRLLADAVNLPLKFRIENQPVGNAMVSTGPMADAKEGKLLPTVLSEEENEKRWAEAAMLTDAMKYNSFKWELKAVEESMQKDPDGKVFNKACERLLDAAIEAEAREKGVQERPKEFCPTVIKSVPAQDKGKQERPKEICSAVIKPVTAQDKQDSQIVAVSGSDRASTSATLQPAKGLPDHIDVNAFSQVFAPTVTEKIWPSLPSKKTAPTVQQTVPSKDLNVKPAKNVWVEKSKARKTFMNAGIGGKLTQVLPTAAEFFIDVNKAHTIQDIWGYSLLGQYVGHNPGHHLIHAMIKGWGVRAKYKLEEGWFIFTFESEGDRDKVLIGGPYLIHGRPMLLKNIPDKFAFNRKDLALVPLWVRIYGLASRFWTTEILGGIASYVGCPMYMDPVTDSRKRNAYARVLVEINLAEPVTKSVPIRFSDGDSVEVHFMVENQPKFCTACCSYGHACVDCQFLAKKATAAVISQEKKAAVNKPQAVLSSHDNSHLTMPSPAANMPSMDAKNRVLESAVNTPVPVQKNQVDCLLPGASLGTNAKAIVDPNILRSSPDVAKQKVRSNGQMKQVPSPSNPSILNVIHNDVELANQFAALNEATDDIPLRPVVQSVKTGDVIAGNITVENLDSNLTGAALKDSGQIQGNEQGQDIVESTGQQNKKVLHSTPTSKVAYVDFGHSEGPKTRSKMKQLIK